MYISEIPPQAHSVVLNLEADRLQNLILDQESQYGDLVYNRSNTEFDIGLDQSKLQEMQERTKGAKTIPQIFIGETYVGGYNELKALEIAGKLNPLLEI